MARVSLNGKLMLWGPLSQVRYKKVVAVEEDGPMPHLETTRGGRHPRCRIQEGGWMSGQQGGTPKYKAEKSTRRTAAFTSRQGL